jgi:hypothetical protein
MESRGPSIIISIGLAVLLLFARPGPAQQGMTDLTGPEIRQFEQLITENPAAALALAYALQQRGMSFPEAVLRQAVEAAFQKDAPWAYTETAIRTFDLYKDRPWATKAIDPFVTREAANILLNAERFAGWNREWTIKAIERTASQTPRLVLGEIKRLAAIDAAWAKTLATTAASSASGLAFSYAEGLVAVDPQWARELLQEGAKTFPQAAIRAVQSYLTQPWGPNLFAEAVLREPQWVVGIAATPKDGQPVLDALRQAKTPPVRMLAEIATSPYEREIKVRMGVFMDDLAAGRRTLDEAARISGDDHAYFQALVVLKLAQPQSPAVEVALKDHALTLINVVNQYEQPTAVRFRPAEHLTAQELYALLTYTDVEIFTSSYRGLFERMVARMERENLTGDQLLAQVDYLRFNLFMKSAASFNHIDKFLATVPSAVARWALLTRCMEDMGQPTPEVMTQAMTAAEVIEASLDVQSLRLIRDVITSEYQRAEQEQNRHAMAIYGLLAAQLDRRVAADLRTPTLVALATRYRAYFPDFKVLAGAKIFPHGQNIQQHFFYNDDDGKRSFSSFLAQYQRDRAWQVADQDSYVRISTTTGGKLLELYANRPDEAAGVDDYTRMTETLRHIEQDHNVLPGAIVHRGHSTYVDVSIDRIPPTAVLIFLGNCGSYGQLDMVLSKAPGAHIITTKGIGSFTINDPLLKALNEYSLRGKDVVWAEFWKHVESALGSNPRFVDYIPPDKNVSVLFLRAYRAVMADRQA